MKHVSNTCYRCEFSKRVARFCDTLARPRNLNNFGINWVLASSLLRTTPLISPHWEELPLSRVFVTMDITDTA